MEKNVYKSPSFNFLVEKQLKSLLFSTVKVDILSYHCTCHALNILLYSLLYLS